MSIILKWILTGMVYEDMFRRAPLYVVS